MFVLRWLGSFFGWLEERREATAQKKLNKYIESIKDLDNYEELAGKAYANFWKHLRYYLTVDEDEYAMAASLRYANKKVESTGRSDLYNWWVQSAYIFMRIKIKVERFV